MVVGAEIVSDGEFAELQEQFEVFWGAISGLDPVRGAADLLFVDGELKAEFLAGFRGELGGGDFDVFGFGTEFEGGFEFDVELDRFAVSPDGFGQFGPVGGDRLAARLDLLDNDGVFTAAWFPGFVHARIAGDKDIGDAAGWCVEEGGFDDDLADEEHGDAEFAGLGPGGRVDPDGLAAEFGEWFLDGGCGAAEVEAGVIGIFDCCCWLAGLASAAGVKAEGSEAVPARDPHLLLLSEADEGFFSLDNLLAFGNENGYA